MINQEKKDTISIKKYSKQAKILIAEPENELLFLFKTCLSSFGVLIDTADSGNEAMARFQSSKEVGRPYDTVVLDTHLGNPSGLDVAKTIRSDKPDQKLVLVTTTPREYLP